MDTTCCAVVPSFFSESTGLYFYSSVFQGNMALLALVYVMVSGRIDRLIKEKESLRDLITTQHQNIIESLYGGTSLMKPSLQNIKEHITRMKSEASRTHANEEQSVKTQLERVQVLALGPFMDEYESVEGKAKEMTNESRMAYLTLSSISVLSLIMLSVAKMVHSCEIGEGTLLCFFIIAQVFVLAVLRRFFAFSTKSK